MITGAKEKRKINGRFVTLTLSGWTFGLIFFLPYVYMMLTALKPKPEIQKIPIDYLPTTWTWSNFTQVWHQIPLATFLKSSFVISFCATMLVLVTQMFSPTALVVGIFREIVKFHLVDTYLALILIYGAFNMAFSIWILSSFFASIPVDIEEAAWIDGASRFKTLRTVILPLAMPGIVTAFIFTFIAAWNEFVIALTLTSSPEHEPLTVGLTSLIGQYQVQWNFLFSGSLIAIVPVVIMFAAIEKYLVGGLTAGSVK